MFTNKTMILLLMTFLIIGCLVPIETVGKDANKTIVLTSDNLVVLNQEISGETISPVISKAMALDKSVFNHTVLRSNDPIYLFMRTPGGSIQAGLELVESLKSLNRPVATVTAFSASMGFQLVQQLDRRYITRDGVLMSHRAKGAFEGEFGGLQFSQMDNRKNFWERRLLEMDQQTVKRTGGKQTLANYQQSYASEMWVTGSQAVEQGYADEVVHIQCDSSLDGFDTFTAQALGGWVTLEYDIDRCPLNSAPRNVRVQKVLTNKGYINFSQFLAYNGGYGVSCQVEAHSNITKVCMVDVSVTPETLDKAKKQFIDSRSHIEQHVIPMILPL